MSAQGKLGRFELAVAVRECGVRLASAAQEVGENDEERYGLRVCLAGPVQFDQAFTAWGRRLAVAACQPYVTLVTCAAAAKPTLIAPMSGLIGRQPLALHQPRPVRAIGMQLVGAARHVHKWA